MFFETSHSLKEIEFTTWKEALQTFPIHIHRSFECFEQIRGSTEVLIGDTKYTLNSGEAVLIFPFQPHSYTCTEHGEARLTIFSPEMVSTFYKENKNKIPTNSKFICTLTNDTALDTVFHKKAIAYFICGEFEKNREYIDNPNKLGDQLLVSLLIYADRNFRSRCLLRDAATEIGYDYAYVSKFFKSKVGMSFRQYVNSLRIFESKQLLKTNLKSITEISEECGFASVRAFDREFFAQTGMTPSEYKNKKARATQKEGDRHV